ncbi:MAG: cytochrome P450 [Halieaceae bacterium]|nr:cytochrome P450 [Halieaceae bacterium]MCP5163928.1 cytochrome P450 [Pseudomonadales bacterium]MCP5202978.1 cytochrome P450 [Pseudomonadales bacterium]
MTDVFDIFRPEQAQQDPYSLPLDQLDVANPFLFAQGAEGPWFKRLRDEAPVHYCHNSFFGPYWSVTRYQDIMQVDTSHDIYSSEPAITIRDPIEDFPLPMFIAMDRPRHDAQRKVVAPATGPENLRNFEPIIRQRTADVLDHLPAGETFNWVESVSIELTTRMLATLFDFPFEERSLLTYWSDVATAIPGLGLIDSEEHQQQIMLQCLEYFTGLWNERVTAPPGNDLISMLAHGEATRDMSPIEYLGNLVLLIVGGNDTTRNTMSASVLALHNNPDQFARLVAEPVLIPSMVAETVRWQTPLAHMRRTAKVDTELGGQQIRAGDKVIMWYVSGNRDERAFDRPDDYLIDRHDVRKHLAFGFGIHRCMGNRLAELQLRVLWEEILKRFRRIEVVGEAERTPSSFVHGYTRLPVVVHPL